MVGDNIKKKIK